MSGRPPQVLRMSWSVVIPCIYGSYHLYRAKLLAKVKNQDDSSKKNSDISIAACRSCKKVMKCLMADHQDGKKDFKTVERLKWEGGGEIRGILALETPTVLPATCSSLPPSRFRSVDFPTHQAPTSPMTTVHRLGW